MHNSSLQFLDESHFENIDLLLHLDPKKYSTNGIGAMAAAAPARILVALMAPSPRYI
jgi:hypothetical protein